MMTEVPISYKDQAYPNLEKTGILNVNSNKAYINCRESPDIVRSRFGKNGDRIDLLSYKGLNLIPSEGTYRLAKQTGTFLSSTEIVPYLPVVDVGTGSGLIAITIACELKRKTGSTRTVVATDISAAALEVATINALLNDVSVELRQRDLLDGLAAEYGKIGVLISNPPFYFSGKIPDRMKRSSFAPYLAIDGGYDALDLYRKLFVQAHEAVSDEGMMIFQVPDYQNRALHQLVESSFMGRAYAFYSGKERHTGALIVGTPHHVQVWGAA